MADLLQGRKQVGAGLPAGVERKHRIWYCRNYAYNLVSDGYEVVSAYSYSMAVSLLKEEYHLALLDINLPDGNGLDFCSKLKEKYPETYIIFLTANDKESDMLKGYEVGATDYITKPFSVAVLCSCMGNVFLEVLKKTFFNDTL